MLSAEIEFPGRLLAVQNNTIYYSVGLDIFKYEYCARRQTQFASVRPCRLDRLIQYPTLLRALRRDCHSATIAQSGALWVCCGNNIYRIDSGKDSTPKVTAKLDRGHPLRLLAEGDQLIFGEYRSNPERSAVRILSVEDEVVETKYIFRPGTIRHIHAIYKDPIEERFLVLTGDNDSESGLLSMSRDFRDCRWVVRGTQQARAMGVIALRDNFVLPMDTPLEANWIQLVDRNSGTIEQLRQVASSVFSVERCRGICLAGTGLEPSTVNEQSVLELYGSSDGVAWRKLLRLRRGHWFVRGMELVTTYPRFRLCKHRGSGEFVAVGVTGSTRGGEVVMLFETHRLRKYLRDGRVSERRGEAAR